MPAPARAATRADRAVMDYDAVIVGAGPAGLACAIRLKQLDPGRTVCVVEKGGEVGAHILSGAVIDPRALDELLPDWRLTAPLATPARQDRFYLLTARRAFRLPVLRPLRNRGCYIGSLANLSRWLAVRAQALGVEIYPGFAAAEMLYDAGTVIGVATGDQGVGSRGEKLPNYEAGVELHARQTVLAEGCHGSLTKTVINRFGLRDAAHPQTYALGVKEIWEVPGTAHREGLVVHSVGWPLDGGTYGGGWLYHMADGQVSLGFVVGLDYKNPYLSPFEEMQRFKTHPLVRRVLRDGRRVAFGAKTLSEGGLQSMPRLAFPGGVLVGDGAGFLDMPRIKGTHTAMKSGMLAADALYDFLNAGTGGICEAYPQAVRASWVWRDLYRSRNVRPGFRWGLVPGLLHAAWQMLGGWRLPVTLKNHADHAQLHKAAEAAPIAYPPPDHVLTFDRLESVRLTGVAHAGNQPCHLKLKDPAIPIEVNLPLYAEPAQRYCPAAVYEVAEIDGQPRFVINAQNCIHCKTCDIKDPSQNIVWTVPQGGGGPNYPNM